MTYYNKTTNKYYRGGALHTDKGTIFNPSEATLKAHGYAPWTPPVVEPEPIDASELRRQAYEAEADRYLTAYQGYLLEGNLEAAENCKQAYLAKKREIRARIS